MKCCAGDESVVVTLLGGRFLFEFRHVAEWAMEVGCVRWYLRYAFNDSLGVLQCGRRDMTHSLMPEFQVFMWVCLHSIDYRSGKDYFVGCVP